MTPTARVTSGSDFAIPSLASVAGRLAWAGTLGLTSICWLLIFNQLRLEWSVNPTYGYGWAVPLLAAFLVWERWRRRPESAAPSVRGLWLAIPVAALFLYLPVRIVQEANPDWVKANWALTLIAVTVSLSAAYGIGKWRYVAFLAFPVLFCMTALPWPVWMEDYMVQSLMRGNARICAELMTLFGHPALAEGNLIQVGRAWVNVEEACSGIRSLQTAFMVSLFLGEFYRLRLFGRLGLLLSSVAVAFALNLARTLALTILTATGGAPLAEKWHDTIGNAVMFLCLASLWIAAELFQRMDRSQQLRRAGRPARAALAPFPMWLAVGGIVWLGFCEAATAGWYGYHERDMHPSTEWGIHWPTYAAYYHQVELPERTKALLKVNDGESATWRSDSGALWQMYFLKWNPGRVSKFLSSSHYPTVCLPASGLKLVAETGPFTCQIGGLTIPFRTYLFDNQGHEVHVFHAIIEDVPVAGDAPLYRQANTTERIRSCLRGERNLGQRVLGIAITGPLGSDEARQELVSTLNKIITTTGAPGAGVARISTPTPGKS
jgi:exosortase